MNDTIQFIHYGTIAAAVAVNALSVGIGQGLTSSSALDAINRQPRARDDITKAAIMGMALIETAAVMGTFIAFILLLANKQHFSPWHTTWAELGIAVSICIPGLVLGIVSAWPAQAACQAIARQPFSGAKILRFMLITLSLIQTPIIFGMITALLINTQAATILTTREVLRLIAGGIAIGFGCIGPALGLALFARTACTSIGLNEEAYTKITSFTFLSLAIIETPIIFAFVISLSLLFLTPSSPTENIIQGCAFLAAGICAGLGTIGAGISSGRTAAAACKQIGLNPDSYGILSRTSLFAQGLIETNVIYAILIAFLLLLL